MEPISLITGALAAGASAVGKKAVTDSYEALKGIIKNKFTEKDNSQGQMALDKIEDKPEIWEPVLEDALTEIGAHKDDKLIEAAQSLMQLAAPEQAAQGKFVIQGKNVQGVVQADKIESLTQNFGNPPKEK